MGGRVDQAELGRRLAHMHLAEPGVRFNLCRATVRLAYSLLMSPYVACMLQDPSALAGKFGFACDNTIG